MLRRVYSSQLTLLCLLLLFVFVCLAPISGSVLDFDYEINARHSSSLRIIFILYDLYGNHGYQIPWRNFFFHSCCAIFALIIAEQLPCQFAVSPLSLHPARGREKDVCFSYINSEVTPRKPKPDNLYDDGPDKARAQAKRRGA